MELRRGGRDRERGEVTNHTLSIILARVGQTLVTEMKKKHRLS